MKCCAGSVLFGPGSLGKGRLSETLRPLLTSRAAATRLAGVMRLIIPFWSSLPQRPQLRRSRIQDVTSFSVGSGCRGMAILLCVGAHGSIRPTMKITDVLLTLFAWDDIPATQYGRHTGRFSGSSQLGLLTIGTDEGVQGHAFLGSAMRGAQMDGQSLIHYLKPLVLGQDPFDRERLYQTMWQKSRQTTLRAIGAMDIALWDIAGKIAGLPIHKLLGSYRTSVPAYASSAVLPSKEAYAEEAARFKADGWTAYKIHPPTDPAVDIEVCRAVRRDVAVKGGISALVKAAHLAEAFHMNYEVHHGGNSLNNVANLHVIMAIKNCEFFEVLLPAGAQKYGLAQDIEVDPHGLVHAFEGPGLGAAIDFPLIERKKTAVLS